MLALKKPSFPDIPWLPQSWAHSQQSQVPDSVTTWGCLEAQTMEPVSLSGLWPLSSHSLTGGFDFRLREGSSSATNVAVFGSSVCARWDYSKSKVELGVLTLHFLVLTCVCQTENDPQVSLSCYRFGVPCKILSLASFGGGFWRCFSPNFLINRGARGKHSP